MPTWLTRETISEVNVHQSNLLRWCCEGTSKPMRILYERTDLNRMRIAALVQTGLNSRHCLLPPKSEAKPQDGLKRYRAPDVPGWVEGVGWMAGNFCQVLVARNAVITWCHCIYWYVRTGVAIDILRIWLLARLSPNECLLALSVCTYEYDPSSPADSVPCQTLLTADCGRGIFRFLWGDLQTHHSRMHTKSSITSSCLVRSSQ